MDLRTIVTNIINDYDPALLGMLAVSFPAAIGLGTYSCIKQIYSDFKSRRNKEIQKESLLVDVYDGGYEI